MGYQVGSVCYGTWDEAGQVARFNLGHDSTVVVGGSLHLVQYFPQPGEPHTMLWKVTRMPDGVEVAQATLGYALPQCEVLGVTDGIAIGWMVAAAWLAAFGLMFLARVLRGETGGSYGSA